MKMRLNDWQYRLLTRTGLIVVVCAAVAFDRLPASLQSGAFAVAIIGAIVGFFPLLTSKPFDSPSQEGDSLARHPIDLNHVVKSPQTTDARLAAVNVAIEAVREQLKSKAPDLYNRHLHAAMTASPKLSEFYISLLGPRGTGIRRDPFCFIGLDTEAERSGRIAEMHQLIQKLTGIPQSFSVELKSNNSIVIHCERPKETVGLLQEEAKKWNHQVSTSESGKREMVH